MLKALFGLPATVWLLGLISLVNDSASELLYPLAPLYLASVLMAGPKALGIIEGDRRGHQQPAQAVRRSAGR